MSGAASIAAIGGIGLQAVGAIGNVNAAREQAQAQRDAMRQQADAYTYQAQVSRNNAMIAEWQARSALQAGAKAEQSQRLKAAGLAGTQRAALAANGVDLGQGNALNILMDTDYMNEREVRTIRDNAGLQAWGYRTQGQSQLDNAALLDAGAFNASSAADSISSGPAVASAMLNGVTQVASSWYSYQKAFAKPTGQFLNAGGGKNLTPFDVSSRF
ncbi:MAG: hypothetical protein KUL86_06975 [Castellaniella sp.]|nr:hypothetical protein [Castellaniella sp.]